MGAVCTDPAQGPRCADTSDTDCATGSGGALVSDYASQPEAESYLSALDAAFDPDDYLTLVELGGSVSLEYDLEGNKYERISVPLLAARIAQPLGTYESLEENQPRILFVCGEHAHEWIPQETCLGLVDWLVQAANSPPGTPEKNDADGLLDKTEVWVVVQANPGGRLKDEDYDGSGAHGSSHYFNQRKNHQWVGYCASDWENEDRSGRCYGGHLNTRGNVDWQKEGVNTAGNYSTGWSTDAAAVFGRDRIVDDPALGSARAPEEHACGVDTDCQSLFLNHPFCVQYLTPSGTNTSGCFMQPMRNTVPLCQAGAAYGTVDEHGMNHSSCLLTQNLLGANRALLWECGNDGLSSYNIAISCASGVITCPASKPDLLGFCDQGVLVSCDRYSHDDAACQNASPNDFQDTDTDTTWGTPWELPTADHLYCDDSTGYCAVDMTRTCCAQKYRGTAPFEAVEARAIRDLVNNVPFSIVVNMHSARGDLGYTCTNEDNGCGDGSTPAKPLDVAFVNGEGMRDAMLAAFGGAASDDWSANYGGTPDDPTHLLAFPAFAGLAPNDTSSAGNGQLHAWLANKSTHDTFHGAAVPATVSNFDNDTLRATPSFIWEMGALAYNQDANTAAAWRVLSQDEQMLYKRLNYCMSDTDTDVPGSSGQPYSTFFVLNQLAGAKGMLSYLADQAVAPQASHDTLGTSFVVPDIADMAIAGLRVGDALGRGVQQSELDWRNVNDDETAEVVIPAGVWDVSVELSGGGPATVTGPSGDKIPNMLTASLDVFVEKLHRDASGEWAARAAPGLMPWKGDMALGMPVTVQGGDRRRLNFGYRFEAGNVYRVTAKIVEPTPVGLVRTMSNNTRIAQFRVVDCQNGFPPGHPFQGERPNGQNPEEFCQAGLPFDNARMYCGTTGLCQECGYFSTLPGDGCDAAWETCVNGMCDGVASCWSGGMKDDYEGKAEDGPREHGLGTYQWEQTFFDVDGSDDMDMARFYLSPSKAFPGGYTVEVHAYDLCENLLDPDLPSQQIEVSVGLESSPDNVTVLDDWLSSGMEWRRPSPIDGLSAELTAKESVAFESGQGLLVKTRRSFEAGYEPLHDSFRYRMFVTVKRTGQKAGGVGLGGPGLPGAKTVLDVQDVVVFKSLVGIPVPKPGLVFYQAGLDIGAVERGDRVFLRLDGTSGGSPEDIDFVVVDPEGVVVAEAADILSGLAVPLDGLEPEGGPYTVRISGEEGGLLDSLYLCPEWVDNCTKYNPTEEACLPACGAGQACCLDGSAEISGCVDVQNDRASCGACGRACGPDETCRKGVCVGVDGPFFWDVTCPAGMWSCPGATWWAKDATCKALKADNTSCGVCGIKCPSNTSCAGGLCVPKCGTSCNKECADGKSCCWVLGVKRCIDLSQNPLHCGSCGTACGCGEVCSEGQCTKWFQAYDPCPGVRVNCGRDGIECVNLSTDPKNCGSCRFSCPDGVGCENGQCVDRRDMPTEQEEY